MSKQFLAFLTALRDNPAMLIRYNPRNLSQLLFHARNEGFDFTAQDVAAVAGKLEADVILHLDQDTFDQGSRLWRCMWGKYHLEYLIDHVVKRYTDNQLHLLIERREPETSAPSPARPVPAVAMPGISRNLLSFLRTVATRADVLASLKVKEKDQVIAAAAAFGFPFHESEFDIPIWGLEAYLSSIRGEPFDAQFTLWQTMWGKYYLEYLVLDMMTSFEEAQSELVVL